MLYSNCNASVRTSTALGVVGHRHEQQTLCKMWRWKVSRPSIQSWLPGIAKAVGPSCWARAATLQDTREQAFDGHHWEATVPSAAQCTVSKKQWQMCWEPHLSAVPVAPRDRLQVGPTAAGESRFGRGKSGLLVTSSPGCTCDGGGIAASKGLSSSKQDAHSVLMEVLGAFAAAPACRLGCVEWQ